MNDDLRQRLQTIYDTENRLTPAMVVDAARPQDHPLHHRFEWDDSAAGEAWRRHQAHDLIRSVRIVYREATTDEAERAGRAFHAVRDSDGYAYQPTAVVVADPLMAKMVLIDMEREWRQLYRRFRDFQEFWDMVVQDMAVIQDMAAAAT